MSSRNQTIASLFTVAMGAMLVGAVVGSQVPRSTVTDARAAEGAFTPEDAQRSSSAPIGVGLDTFKDIARHAVAGTVPTRRAAAALTDDAIIERLVPIRGVGRWTVEMLLIFTLGRHDEAWRRNGRGQLERLAACLPGD